MRFYGFCRNPWKIILRLFGVSETFVSAFSSSSHKKCDCPLEFDEKLTFDTGKMYKKGVRGMFPLGCLPLWGREGVTLIVF